jgi:hypothetical protein
MSKLLQRKGQRARSALPGVANFIQAYLAMESFVVVLYLPML